eukprot:4345838-Alexandrium_andersonii.AAC.1
MRGRSAPPGSCGVRSAGALPATAVHRPRRHCQRRVRNRCDFSTVCHNNAARCVASPNRAVRSGA